MHKAKRDWPEFQFSRKRGSKQSSHESLTRVDDALQELQGVNVPGSFGQHVHRMRADIDKEWKSLQEIDEFDVREDLRCWAAKPVT
jgi:hypothetical protein